MMGGGRRGEEEGREGWGLEDVLGGGVGEKLVKELEVCKDPAVLFGEVFFHLFILSYFNCY